MNSRPPGLQEQVPLALLTTFETGGSAQYFLEATEEPAIEAALEWAAGEGIQVTVLGGGSNVVVADEGVPGLVLRIATRGVSWIRSGSAVEVTAAAGERWDALAVEAVRRELGGFECLVGIPGCVGATPIQNVGAYGQEVGDAVRAVHGYDRQSQTRFEFDRAACGFGYRTSVFKQNPGRYLVTSVCFDLTVEASPRIAYRELEDALEQEGASLSDVSKAVLQLRAKKSMLLDPSDPNHRSAGSFFTNPIVSNNDADRVAEQALSEELIGRAEEMPRYAAGENRVKLAAAWLIERAGFAKGTTRGAVGLSSNHSLAIVNRGGARSAEILAFAQTIRDAVHERFRVTLVPEPQLIGVAWEKCDL